MKLAVIERHTFLITDADLAADLRQALATGDLERLDELVTHLNADGPNTSDVLECNEVKR